MGMWGVGCGMWDVGCGMWGGSGVWGVGCGMCGGGMWGIGGGVGCVYACVHACERGSRKLEKTMGSPSISYLLTLIAFTFTACLARHGISINFGIV